jgi:hypothetical protein
VKRILAVFLVAATFGTLPHWCSAQYMYPQNMAPARGWYAPGAQPMYRPQLTSMTVFQDGGVPIPADPGNPVASPATTVTPAPQADPAMSSPSTSADSTPSHHH